MHKPSIVALLPVFCLAVTASAAHLFNNSRPQAKLTPFDEPTFVAHSVEDLQVRGEIEKALDQIIQSYRKQGFKGLESRTVPERWRQWQNTTIGKDVSEHIKLLASWPSYTLQKLQVRPSGHMEAYVSSDGELLRVWMAQKEGEWKLIGVVIVSQS